MKPKQYDNGGTSVLKEIEAELRHRAIVRVDAERYEATRRGSTNPLMEWHRAMERLAKHWHLPDSAVVRISEALFDERVNVLIDEMAEIAGEVPAKETDRNARIMEITRQMS